jgi:hypothetical protein
MTHLDEADPVLPLSKPLHNPVNAITRHAEYHADSLYCDCVNQDVCRGARHVTLLS